MDISEMESEARIQVMIMNAINRYDAKQELRHRENTAKLELLKQSIDESHGVRRIIVWMIPLVVAILSIIAEVLRK